MRSLWKCFESLDAAYVLFTVNRTNRADAEALNEPVGYTPTRPLVSTLSTVSNGSQLVIPLIVIFPLDWVNGRFAPVRRSVTRVTAYPLSRTPIELPLAGSMTCT